MSRPYYILAVRDYPATGVTNRKWGCEFGDYEKECVEYERERFRRYYPANCLRIIRLADDHQSTIDAAVAALNAR